MKHEKKNLASIKQQESLLKELNKMIDKSELIRALAIAIGCLKSKTFDAGIIEDLEETLNKHFEKKEKENEKV